MEYVYNNDFAVFRLCNQLEEVFSTSKSVRCGLYVMLWVTEGMVDLFIDEIRVPLNAGQMIFVTPVKYVKILENHGKVHLLQFNREFYCIRENDHEVSCDGILYFGAPGVPVLDLEDKEVESFSRLIGILKEEFEIVDPIQEEMLRTILKKWLIKSTRILKRQENFVRENEPKAELLRQFNILLEKHYREFHQVKEYAQLLNRSPKTIANQFKLLGQESPSMMIQQRLVIEAKRYLLYAELSVKEIAFRLGFEDASTFSHFFKSKTGAAPKKFRAMHHLQPN